MIAIFYDRKNRRVVRSDQLVQTSVVAEVIQGDSQDPPESFKDLEWEWVSFDESEGGGGTHLPGRLSWHTIQLGTLGYKSPNCPKHLNYDLYCSEADLVFLELV